MPLIPMRELLHTAQTEGYAVGYFEAWDQYSLEAVVEAAEEARAPVIIGFGGAMVGRVWLDAGGVERWGALGREVAACSKVPVAFILNEVDSYEQIVRGIVAGFNAVMLASAHHPYEENVRLTAKVVEIAHAIGVDVEAELGLLPGPLYEAEEEGVATLTDPDRAAEFVARTGIDALAVSVGNIHLKATGKAHINFDLLQQIHARVHVPLVIHGGTSFPDEAVPRAVSLGVAKFNVGTALKMAFFNGIRATLESTPDPAALYRYIGSRCSIDVLAQGKMQMKETVARLIQVYRCQG
jgi:ketose-bisphosphate aldolase